MNDIQLKVSIVVAAAELEHFYHPNGGNRLLPLLDIDDNQSELKIFTISDDDAKATISFRPLENDQSLMTVNINNTELWGWQLGVPGRSELGVNTYLGVETSPKCEKFCNDFVEHLNSIGYMVTTATTQKGRSGRPRKKGYEWARKEIYINNRDKDEVYLEWLEKFPEEHENQQNKRDCFNHGINPKSNGGED